MDSPYPGARAPVADERIVGRFSGIRSGAVIEVVTTFSILGDITPYVSAAIASKFIRSSARMRTRNVHQPTPADAKPLLRRDWWSLTVWVLRDGLSA